MYSQVITSFFFLSLVPMLVLFLPFRYQTLKKIQYQFPAGFWYLKICLSPESTGENYPLQRVRCGFSALL